MSPHAGAAPRQAPSSAPSTAAPGEATPSAAAPTDGTGSLAGKKIAFLSQGASNEWAIQLDAVAQEAVKRTGAELLYFDSQGSGDVQVQQMEDAQALGADIIVITPMAAGALVGPASRAEAAGTPVINCVNPIDGEDWTSFVGWDWAGMYGRAMKWLADEMGGKGNIIMLHGLAGSSTSDLSENAAKEVLKDYPDIKVVGEGYSDWSIAKAKTLTETFLAKGDQIDGVWAMGGEPTTGAIQAFADAGKPMPLLTGATGQNGALRVLLENNVKFFGIPSPPSASFTCIDVATKVLNGETVEKFYNMTELGGFEDFTEADVANMYQPQYADGYQEPTDDYLSQEQLKAANLLRTE